MLCLVYLETEPSSPLANLLKSSDFEVHIATDGDDLLNQLWYHGFKVGCIVLEAQGGDDLDEVFEALLDWPELPILVYGSIGRRADLSLANLHHKEEYSLESVASLLPRLSRMRTRPSPPM